MNAVLSFIESLNIQFYEISHDIIEHKEARSLINHLFFTSIDQIEDGGEYFVHPLNVSSLGVQFGIDEEYARHIIVPISLSLLLFIPQPRLQDIGTIAMNHLVSLLTSLCRKGYLYRLHLF